MAPSDRPQEADKRTPTGIRTCYRRRPAAAELRFRSCGHWDGPSDFPTSLTTYTSSASNWLVTSDLDWSTWVVLQLNLPNEAVVDVNVRCLVADMREMGRTVINTGHHLYVFCVCFKWPRVTLQAGNQRETLVMTGTQWRILFRKSGHAYLFLLYLRPSHLFPKL
jgi:hypothetical protein